MVNLFENLNDLQREKLLKRLTLQHQDSIVFTILPGHEVRLVQGKHDNWDPRIPDYLIPKLGETLIVSDVYTASSVIKGDQFAVATNIAVNFEGYDLRGAFIEADYMNGEVRYFKGYQINRFEFAGEYAHVYGMQLPLSRN